MDLDSFIIPCFCLTNVVLRDSCVIVRCYSFPFLFQVLFCHQQEMSSPPWQGQEQGCSATVIARMYTQRKKEKHMVTLFFLLMALIVLASAAFCWSADSSDGVNSPEWEQRQYWHGFH
jgi:predicted nucleic acid-binding Zn ribbon protein